VLTSGHTLLKLFNKTLQHSKALFTEKFIELCQVIHEIICDLINHVDMQTEHNPTRKT